MGMVVQHNISAMNANEAMRKNVAGLKKQTEKLSTGYNINRAADNAAGLAISEKMRSQIRGLTQASANSNDAISLIQTAEGGLQETEDILQRMRELSVQSANGTYTDEDRQQIQYEVDALKEEVDRISQATEYNEMKLLDGSLSGAGGATTEYGAKYGVVSKSDPTAAPNGSIFDGSVITSNVQGAKLAATLNATKGGESATWEADGKTLTLNLEADKTYTQDDIDKLIANADTKKADGVVAQLSVKLDKGVLTTPTETDQADAATAVSLESETTVAGVRAESKAVNLLKASTAADPTDQAALDAANKAIADETDADIKAVANALVADPDADTSAYAPAKVTAGKALADAVAAAQKTIDDKAAAAGAASAGLLTSATTGYGDTIKFTSNSYGVDTRQFAIATDVAAGKESIEAVADDTVGAKDGKFILHLSTGVDYTEDDIEKIMAKSGLDYSVDIADSAAPDGDVKAKFDIKKEIAAADITTWKAGTSTPNGAIDMGAGTVAGAGVGKEEVAATGEGLTFQIGANGVEDQRLTVNVDDMSSKALGINNISVAKQDDANTAINKIDDAIKAVSTQRAKLGAVQNRLEHTVNSLNTANENLSASESQIRDTDMAAEMIKYTKSNILQQASQSMLAQANQQPQGVLQLLG